MKALRTRDSVAFAALHRRHCGAVLGDAERRIADRETAREIALDVFRVARERRLQTAVEAVDGGGGDGERGRDVLDALPEAVREVLVLTYWDGLSASEADALLGCSAGAVRVRLHRARTAFAAVWEEQG